LIKEFIDKSTVLQADKRTTFSDLRDCIDFHVREIFGTKDGNFKFKWVHIAISNLNKHLKKYHIITERMIPN
jgi:hypothetical protein